MYKQAVLGIEWAVLVPLFQPFIFTVIFGRLAGIKPDGSYPYSLFVARPGVVTVNIEGTAGRLHAHRFYIARMAAREDAERHRHLRSKYEEGA